MKRTIVILIAALVLALMLKSALFIVERGEAALVTQLGEPVRIIEGPGLYVKAPLPLQSVRSIDTRLRVWDSAPLECATADSSAIVVEVYAAWRVRDPRTFADACGTPERAQERMADVLLSELSAAVARYPLTAFASTQAVDLRTSEVLRGVRRDCRKELEGLGVEVADLGITGMTLPGAARQAVIDRMGAERSAAAAIERAAGEEAAARIRAAADSERQVILADARSEAERIRSEADAAATAVYAEAHSADPEFYEFLRTLDSYKAFMDGRTTVVLSSDSELLELIREKE